jgi:hypothetical protein
MMVNRVYGVHNGIFFKLEKENNSICDMMGDF